MTAKYANARNALGRSGNMSLSFTDLTFTNQHGEVVAKLRIQAIMRNSESGS